MKISYMKNNIVIYSLVIFLAMILVISQLLVISGEKPNYFTKLYYFYQNNESNILVGYYDSKKNIEREFPKCKVKHFYIAMESNKVFINKVECHEL